MKYMKIIFREMFLGYPFGLAKFISTRWNQFWKCEFYFKWSTSGIRLVKLHEKFIRRIIWKNFECWIRCYYSRWSQFISEFRKASTDRFFKTICIYRHPQGSMELSDDSHPQSQTVQARKYRAEIFRYTKLHIITWALKRIKVQDTEENRILLTKFCLQIACLDNIQVCLREVHHKIAVGNCSEVHNVRFITVESEFRFKESWLW